MADNRQHSRHPIDIKVHFAPKSSSERIEGLATDISLGGMFVLTAKPMAFGAEVVVYMTLFGHKAEMALPARVRWTCPDGMGVQFGLLGARETHAITELTKRT